jgi:hypothetical protein
VQKDRTGTWDISCLAAVVEWCRVRRSASGRRGAVAEDARARGGASSSQCSAARLAWPLAARAQQPETRAITFSYRDDAYPPNQIHQSNDRPALGLGVLPALLARADEVRHATASGCAAGARPIGSKSREQARRYYWANPDKHREQRRERRRIRKAQMIGAPLAGASPCGQLFLKL